MKNEKLIKVFCFVMACACALLMTGCGHSGNLVGVGKVFKIGNGEYGLTYVNGLFMVNGTRENTESIIETNDSDALGNPSDVKTVRAIRYRTGMQINGYLVDLAEKSPETAVEYVKVMPSLPNKPTDLSNPETAKESSTIAKPIEAIVKERLEKIAGDSSGYKSPVKGDGTYTKLYEDNSVSYQAALCADLLTYADDTTEMPTTGETIKESLVHYAGRLAQIKAKGIDKATKITLDRCTIKGGKLTYLMYRLKNSDGTYQDEECPSCFEIEEK